MSNLAEQVKQSILINRKRQQTLNFLKKQKIQLKQLLVPIHDVRNQGECSVFVRNEKCSQISCLFDISDIVSFILEEYNKSGHFNMVKCPQCSSYVDQSGYFVDLDMEDAIKVLKEYNFEIYEQILFEDYSMYEVLITIKNEFILKNKKDDQTVLLKESDMLTEYEKNYPTYQSKQTHEFYENGWVFVNENVDVLSNNKLQSVLYLFFPSLQSKWKKIEIYLDVQGEKQAFFQKYMSVSKMYSRELGQHSILASGGFGFPEKEKYETRTFEVELFRDDPDQQIQGKVNLINRNRMFVARVFHYLICHEGKVYAIGGYMRDHTNNTDISLKSCERYDPKTQQWEQISDLHHPRQLFSVISYKGKLFVIGGKVQNSQNNQEEEDLTIEYFDTQTDRWTYATIFTQQSHQKYFTERPYCFVKQNDVLVIFGGRKEKTYQDQKPCERSRQAAELNLITGEHQLSKSFLPPCGIPFEGVTDFQGIYYNNRFIFGFKQIGKEDRKDYIIPSVCKYYEQSNEKFTVENFKKIYF